MNLFSRKETIKIFSNNSNEKIDNKIIFILSIFLAIFSYTSFYSNLHASSIDSVEQWVNVTNQMFYGKNDFLFSYGPLYWLTGGTVSLYNNICYWIMVLYLSLNYTFFWVIILCLINKSRNFIFLALAFLLFFHNPSLACSLFMWPFILVAYWAYDDDVYKKLDRKRIIFLGALVGGLFFVRFFYGLVGFLTISTYLFSRFISDKKISLASIFISTVILSYILLGFIIFNNYISLLNYLIINTQLSFGNSVDMTLDIDNDNITLAAVFVTFIILNFYLYFRKKSLLITANFLWLFLMKLGFSRTDHYINYFILPLSTLSLIMIFKKDKLGQISFIFMMGTLYFLSSNSIYPGARTMNVFSVPFNSDIDYSSRLSRIYPDFTLEKNVVNLIGESTVDVYPYNNEYIFSNKLNYFHRPLFQNYMTLTPKLDTINKKFFVSAERPKFILWTAAITCTASNCDPFIEIDNKYVLNEDPLTTNSILSNYHIVMLTKGKGNIPILLLEENNSYTETKETVISKTVMKFNHWYMVPTATLGITKVVPHFEFTIAGRLKNLFFRGNVVNIYYKTYSGEIKNYRLNILNSISGVWVSPLINKMNNSGFIGDNVESIMFQTNDINYFKPNFESIFIK